MKTLGEWIEFCIERHNVVCNQKYDHYLPYSFHLEMVAAQAKKFYNFEDTLKKWKLVSAAVYGHDLIEDARLTYNDIVDHAGKEVADIIFLCTEMRGRNRAERKNDQFYVDLVTNEIAVFVKLCDIAANSLYSTLSNSSMLDKQKEEWPRIRAKVQEYHPATFSQMIVYLDNIYKL